MLDNAIGERTNVRTCDFNTANKRCDALCYPTRSQESRIYPCTRLLELTQRCPFKRLAPIYARAKADWHVNEEVVLVKHERTFFVDGYPWRVACACLRSKGKLLGSTFGLGSNRIHYAIQKIRQQASRGMWGGRGSCHSVTTKSVT